jgi:hypothetical protein
MSKLEYVEEVLNVRFPAVSHATPTQPPRNPKTNGTCGWNCAEAQDGVLCVYPGAMRRATLPGWPHCSLTPKLVVARWLLYRHFRTHTSPGPPSAALLFRRSHLS